MQTSQDCLVGGMVLRVTIWSKSTCNTICNCVMPLALEERGKIDLQVKYFIELILVPLYVACKILVLF